MASFQSIRFTGNLVDGEPEVATPEQIARMNDNVDSDSPGITYRDVGAENEHARAVTAEVGSDTNVRTVEMRQLASKVDYFTERSNEALARGDQRSAKNFALQANQLFSEIQDLARYNELKGLPDTQTNGVTDKGLAQLQREAKHQDESGVFNKPDEFK